MTYQNLNALRALASKCNDEMKAAVRGKAKSERVALLRPISDKYANQAKLIGFDKFRLHFEIGVINQVFNDG